MEIWAGSGLHTRTDRPQVIRACARAAEPGTPQWWLMLMFNELWFIYMYWQLNSQLNSNCKPTRGLVKLISIITHPGFPLHITALNLQTPIIDIREPTTPNLSCKVCATPFVGCPQYEGQGFTCTRGSCMYSISDHFHDDVHLPCCANNCANSLGKPPRAVVIVRIQRERWWSYPHRNRQYFDSMSRKHYQVAYIVLIKLHTFKYCACYSMQYHPRSIRCSWFGGIS